MGALPETIGRYTRHEAFAFGGMARVYFGSLHGATGFSRLVAIKQLHPQVVPEEHARAMFIDEACLAARVHHPNVVAMLDVVHHGDELLLVMEYVHGETLRALARASRRSGARIPTRIVLTVMTNVLHGLDAVHEALAEDGTPLDMVHRDVSPANILVGVDGAARILDFGIAHAARRLEHTRTGTVKGKFAYMAPEQFGGDVVTRRTDIFSAGVVLWELLTGRRLFTRGDDGDNFLVEKMLRGATERPSQVHPSVSYSIDAITMAALALDPRDRFETARAMAVALEQAGELATVCEVGDWVRSTACETLAARALIVRRIESESSHARAAMTSEATVELSARDFIEAPAPTSTAGPREASTPDAERRSLVPSFASITRSERVEAVPARPWARRGAAIGLVLGTGLVAMTLRLLPRADRAPPPTALMAAVLTMAAPTMAAPTMAAPATPPCTEGMLPVPGGKFFMGSDDDLAIARPAHAVTLSPYCIDTFETTTADYKACSDQGECKRAGTTNRSRKLAAHDLLCNERDPAGRATHPMNCVTFEMAENFCRAREKRLPTEAEWEFAARGADGRAYPWGDLDPSTNLLNACGNECVRLAQKNHVFDVHAMFTGDDGWPATAPVGTFPRGASPFGMQDAAGNVSEWVADWFAEYAKSGSREQRDPSGPLTGVERVVRGGAWNGALAASARSTFRYKAAPEERSCAIGFRCAKSR